MNKKMKILTIMTIATLGFSSITTNAMKRNSNNKTNTIKKEEKKSQDKKNLEKQQLEQDKKEIEKNTKNFIDMTSPNGNLINTKSTYQKIKQDNELKVLLDYYDDDDEIPKEDDTLNEQQLEQDKKEIKKTLKNL